MKVVFMGTSDFALPSLRALVETKLDVVAVYTQPPRRSGRGNKIQISSVGRFAQANRLKLCHPENFSDASEIDFLQSLRPDLVLVVAYGLILPKKILEISTRGFFNVHASILPRWRGAAPIQRAILANDKKTGVSIIKLEPTLDTGPIVLQKQLKIESNDNTGLLHDKLSVIGANLTSRLCASIGQLEYTIQSTKGVSYAKKIEKSETQINWDVDAVAVNRQIRAFSPNPGAWFNFGGERIKILECQVSNGKGKPGFVMDEYFQIACLHGSILPMVLQRAGKSPLNVGDFIRGYKVPAGTVLINY
ncbi:MAG: methionyl-tRNA formyltransferase [Paracoccaceae bacterium]|nr:methionyl-tRNA formyltransferase [Paracoccaceae bacterium]